MKKYLVAVGQINSRSDVQANYETVERMIAEASALGADAIVSVRFATSSIMQAAAEVMAYGTAVKLK